MLNAYNAVRIGLYATTLHRRHIGGVRSTLHYGGMTKNFSDF